MKRKNQVSKINNKPAAKRNAASTTHTRLMNSQHNKDEIKTPKADSNHNIEI